MPRWFRAREPVPHLRTLAEALKRGRRLEFAYQRGDGPESTRVAGPLGLVNKAGVWYLVASRGPGEPAVFRVGRITGVRVLDAPFTPPPEFGLAAFWARWSAEFEASRPHIEVRLRASPAALAAFGEIFGDASPVPAAVAEPGSGLPADGESFREVTLTFEHEKAAAHRLAGFGGQVEVLSPPAVRQAIVATARATLARYEPSSSP